MVHGAGKAADQAALLERRQRVPRNPVLGVPDVELPTARDLEMPEIVGDAGLDHGGDVTPDRRRGDADGRAPRGAEEPSTARIRRVDRRLMPDPAQRVAD